MAGASTTDVGEIIEKHRPVLISFIRKRVSSDEDAADILQDVFYQLIKTDPLLDQIEHVTAWLYRVARNTIINRKTKRRESELPYYQGEAGDEEVFQDFAEVLFNDETSPSPETEYLRSLVWDELERALGELPSEQRAVYEMTEVEGLAISQISELTGIGQSTLLSRKHYATLHLRKRLGQLYRDLLEE